MINIPPYTVHIVIGPTHCGKSYFVKNNLKGNRLIISSDDERRYLLGKDYDKYDPLMLEISEPAFDLVRAKLEASMKARVPHIIIDTTGGNRTHHINLAKTWGYNVHFIVFDYKDKSEYYTYVKSNYSLVSKLVRKYTKERLASIRSKEFDYRTNIKKREELVEINLLEPDNIIDLDKYSVIGDIHQNIELAKEIVDKVPKPIIWLGDFIDPKLSSVNHINDIDNISSLKDTLLFMRERLDQGDILIKGNHENYALKRIKGEKEPCLIENEYFSSTKELLANDKLRELFESIISNSLPYLTIKTKRFRTVRISHAPCLEKYLCKPKYTLKNINWYRNRDKKVLEDLEPYLNQGHWNKPFHICGHISHDGNAIQHKNLFLIDTGAGQGGLLTAFCMEHNKWYLSQVGRPNYDLASLKVPPKYEINDKTDRKINYFLNSGVRFISGTMSPSPVYKNQLESIEGALNLFKDKDIHDLMIQPKHMGNRCQVYISPDSYLFTSRKGFPIKYDLSHLKDKLQVLIEQIGASEIILDGELMPWSVLGQGLIEEYDTSIKIMKRVNEILEEIDSDHLHEGLYGYNTDLEEMERTLALYSSQEKAYYKPFSILRMTKSGVISYPEWEWSIDSIWNALGNSNGLYTNVNELSKIKNYMDSLTDLEGIVIKPMKPEDRLKIPYIKVRNEEYLRLVYGPSYLEEDNYKSLVNSKKIDNKLRLSINQYRLGKDMLKDPYKNMVKMLGTFEKEESLDPRL